MKPAYDIDAVVASLTASLFGLDDRPSLFCETAKRLVEFLPLKNTYCFTRASDTASFHLFQTNPQTLLDTFPDTHAFLLHAKEPLAPSVISKLPVSVKTSLSALPFSDDSLIYPVHSFGRLQGIFIFTPQQPLSASDHVLLFTIMHHMLILCDRIATKDHIVQLQKALDDATKAASVFWLINDYMHDLKTPWGLLQAATDPRSGCVTPDDFRDKISKYSQRAYKTLGTINRILARDRDRVSVSIDLGKAVQDVLDAHSDMKVVRFELPKSRPFILGDPSDIDILIINLIKNAKEAIHTDVLKKHDITVQITYDSTLKRVALIVEDTGCGMSNETVSAILSGHAQSTKCFGSGVGTRAILRIVEDHQALIQISSTLGQGSTFKILFPPL